MLGSVKKTLEESQQATEKMNELADNLIFARDVALYSMAFYASYTILKKYLIQPFVSTFRFLRNQTMDMKSRVHAKYGNNVVVIAGATTGLGFSYALYFLTLQFNKIVLIDADYQQLQDMKEKLLKKESKG